MPQTEHQQISWLAGRDHLQPIEIQDRERYARIAADCRGVIRRTEASVVEGHYQLGQLVLEAQAMTTARRNATPIVEALARDVDYCPRLLRLCAQFAAQVPEQLLPQIVAAGLNFEHVRILINHRMLPQIEDWLPAVRQRELSAMQLQEELRQGRLPARQGSGRRPRPPRSAHAGLDQIHSLTTTVANKFDVMFGEQFHLATELLNTPPEQIDDSTRETVVTAQDRLRAIGDSARHHASELEEAIRHIDHVLATQRAAADAPAESPVPRHMQLPEAEYG